MTQKQKTWLMLFIAIICEVTGTTCLKMSDSFTHPYYAIVTVIGFAASFALFIKVLEHMSLGLAYGVWGGVGSACTVAIGIILWGDALTPLMCAGLCLVIVGIIFLNKGTDELEEKQAKALNNQDNKAE